MKGNAMQNLRDATVWVSIGLGHDDKPRYREGYVLADHNGILSVSIAVGDIGGRQTITVANVDVFALV